MWSPVVQIFGVRVPVGGEIGVVVATRLGRVDHKGIVSDRYGDDGEPMVLHASNFLGQTVETTATEFVKRAVGPIRFLGYPSYLPPEEVLRRARAKLGEPYKMLSANCEHFTTGVHGLDPVSPQLQGAMTLGAVTAAVVGAVVLVTVVASRA